MSHPLPPDWTALLRLAETEVTRTIADLPEDLRGHATQLPVSYEARPTQEMVDDGIETDTLGLFLGEPIHEQGASPLPSQVVLFLEVIWEFAEGDPEIFQDEVHVTYLHELGHFLGLNEDELEERGLL